MEMPKFFISLLIQALFISQFQVQAAARNSNLFREYIGAEFKRVKFTDVPINPNVEFHFILAFVIDYDSSNPPSPTNGNFKVYWDSANLSPSDVSSIKNAHSNVKVALSLGGATVAGQPVNFKPSSVDSWVSNAVSSLTSIIKQYHLDGIDIDYENFQADPNTFSDCIGRLIATLKTSKVISFASIAPFDKEEVQKHYLALWKKHGPQIDYVNFQFYAYPKETSVSRFIDYFNTQSSNYNGGKVLASFSTAADRSGLLPENGFFNACSQLRSEQKLPGIFVYSADDSRANSFQYEKQAEALLAGSP